MGSIQQSRYDHLLRRTTAQYGGGSKLGEALEDLFPVLEVENTTSELLRATGWKLGASQRFRNPGAGTATRIQLFNPPGSGHLVVITQVLVGSEANDPVTMGPSFDALATLSVAGNQRDTREGVLRETVALNQTEDDALIASSVNIELLATPSFVLTDPNDVAVLAPGTGWRVGSTSVDRSLRVSFFYRERVAEPEELNF